MNHIIHKSLDKDNKSLFSILIVAIIVVYYMPFVVNQLFFIVILYAIYNSKKDYFWLALFFVLIDAPGRLFTGGAISDTQRIAFYSLSGGITLQFTELFIAVLLFKKLIKREYYPFAFRNTIYIILIFSFFLVIFSIIIGINAENFVAIFRILFPWLLFFIIPQVLNTEEKFIKFNRLIFPFVFLALFSQIYSYFTGNYLAYLLKGVAFREELLSLGSLEIGVDTALRAADSSFILIYSFCFVFFYLLSKQYSFSKKYLITIISISSLSVFLSATRGWILAYLGMLFLIFWLVSRSKRFILRVGLSSILFVSMLIFFVPNISKQFISVFERFETVTYVLKGDFTAAGTLQRLDVRGPRVMGKFAESPIFGWGFSQSYFDYADIHVGHQTMLLNVGVLGFLLLNLIYLIWLKKIYDTANNRFVKNNYGKNTITIFAIGLVGMYIIHSTSSIAWGLDLKLGHILYYSIILQFVSIVYFNAKSKANKKKYDICCHPGL